MLRAVVENPSDADQQHIGRVDGRILGGRVRLFAIAAEGRGSHSIEQIVEIVRDHIPPAIGLTRRYQTLQAMINCTRRSLMPDPNFTEKDREAWQLEIRQLESLGIR